MVKVAMVPPPGARSSMSATSQSAGAWAGAGLQALAAQPNAVVTSAVATDHPAAPSMEMDTDSDGDRRSSDVAMPKRVVVDARRPLGYAELMESRAHRSAVLELCGLFGADVVDVGTQHAIVLLSSWSARVDAFLKLLRPFGIIEVARSGQVAMARLPVISAEDEARSKQDEKDANRRIEV